MFNVSIITITYNRASYIKEAIDSVLNQSFKDFELIVLDDCSTDNTEEIVKSYFDEKIKYFKNDKQLRIAASRNKAIDLCGGKYIAVLDSDDIWYDTEKLKKQIEFLENNKEYALVGTNAIFINDKGEEIKKSSVKIEDKEIRKSILLRNQFFHSSVLFSKDVFINLGNYDENLKIGEDYDLFLRIGQKYKFANLKDYSTKYRVHSGSICVSDKIKASNDTMKIIKKYRTNYPNFFFSLMKSYLRIFIAYFLRFFKK